MIEKNYFNKRIITFNTTADKIKCFSSVELSKLNKVIIIIIIIIRIIIILIIIENMCKITLKLFLLHFKQCKSFAQEKPSERLN